MRDVDSRGGCVCWYRGYRRDGVAGVFVARATWDIGSGMVSGASGHRCCHQGWGHWDLWNIPCCLKQGHKHCYYCWGRERLSCMLHSSWSLQSWTLLLLLLWFCCFYEVQSIHPQMYKCMDLSGILVGLAEDPLLDFGCCTSCNLKGRDKVNESHHHDAAFTHLLVLFF